MMGADQVLLLEYIYPGDRSNIVMNTTIVIIGHL